jgi:endonuclease YncB( thermonuclease family)
MKRRRSAKLYQIWPEARPRTKKAGGALPWRAAFLVFIAVFTAAMGVILLQAEPGSALGRMREALHVKTADASQTDEASGAAKSRSFGYCYTGGGWNCVVDGDTFWMEGVKIRVADIDAPETHPSRCSYEDDLGQRATVRLHDLLNQGPFSLQSLPDRDEDRYGRKLRIVRRNGNSLGDQLVSEGVARRWIGHREPWC